MDVERISARRSPDSPVAIFGDEVKDDTEQTLDEWANRIAALEPEVRDGIMAQVQRLASDRRLPKIDREFAKSQADAIRRALKRLSSENRTKPRRRKRDSR